ncbi:MAG: hypothetical protein ABW352_07120 [Polyangiales bacterium]
MSVEGHDKDLGRAVGHGASSDGRYTRIVDRFTLHREPLDFRALCARVLRPDTRYLLLDLDRTTHRGINLGELLGWEIASFKYFGGALTKSDAPRLKGRLIQDPQRPQRTPGYLLDGARRWAFPGLSYLLWGKLAGKSELLERWSYRKFGSEPIRAVQRLPQTALLHDIATLPKATLRELSLRVWELASPLQVIERADLAWVRERCPGIRIILTSASPRPIVELAGEMLGVDGVEYSTARDLGDRYASPYWVDRRFLLERIDQLSPPSEVRINSGHAKIARLLERYPDLLDAGVESVGMSDTGYGEDHAWGQFLSVVVDVNSTAPFPPLVAFDSPLREVHSALLRTREERTQPAQNDDAVSLTAAELAPRLAGLRDTLEHQAAESARMRRELASQRAAVQAELSAQRARIEDIVNLYNAIPAEHPRLLASLRRALRGEAGVMRKLAQLEQPLSYAAMALSNTLNQARAALDALESPRRLRAKLELEPMLGASPA